MERKAQSVNHRFVAQQSFDREFAVVVNKSFGMRLNRWRWVLVVLLTDFATSKVSATTNILPVNHVTVIDATGAAATSMARGQAFVLEFCAAGV
jgi:hypothetical protein